MAWVTNVAGIRLSNNVYCWCDMQATRLNNDTVQIDVRTFMRPDTSTSTGIGGYFQGEQFLCGTINGWNPPSNAGWKPAGTTYQGQYRDGSNQRSFTINTIGTSFPVSVIWYAGASINAESTHDVTFPAGYVPRNPDLSIVVTATSINNIVAEYSSSDFTEQVSYTYTYRLFSDSGRTNQVFNYIGTNINAFPINWNQAEPGTYYYWRLSCQSVDIQGNTRYMPDKYGVVRTMDAFVNIKNFAYSFTPYPNNHVTPRSVLSYRITDPSTGHLSPGLTFLTNEFQTSLNGLNVNTRTFRNSANQGTVSLMDTTKLIREAKPRDLFYMKVRIVAVDNRNREYYSNWFGVTTGQSIYNWFQLYLTRPGTNEQMRINSRFQNQGTTNEKYWNKGEVK